MFGFSDDADYVYALKSCNLPVYSVFVCFLRCTLHRSWELKTITRQNEHSGSNISVKIAGVCQMWLLCSRNLFCHSLVARDVLGVEGRRSWMFPLAVLRLPVTTRPPNNRNTHHSIHSPQRTGHCSPPRPQYTINISLSILEPNSNHGQRCLADYSMFYRTA